jgi:predicted RNase H-like nuclease
VPDLAGVLADLDAGRLDVVGIDIPIGLPATGARACDVEARAMIGPRRSSVFPVPLRGLLGAVTYGEAASRSRALSGKGISRQAFGILPKVAEVDRVMSPDRQGRIVEVHPEVSLAVLAGRTMAYPKRRPEGRAERLAALGRAFPDVADHAGVRIVGTGPDDVLDAFAVAWTARRYARGGHVQLGGQRDSRGLRMEIIA